MERPPQPNDEERDTIFLLARDNRIQRIAEIIKKVEEKARNDKFSSAQVEQLIAQLINQKEPITGNTMLHYSVLHAYLTLTQFLMEKKADTYIQNAKGDTPLDIATAGENVHIERILKQSCVRRHAISAPELSIPDKFIVVDQFKLARQRDTAKITALIGKIDINKREEITGNTMLHYAALLADISLTQLLLSKGADATIKNTSEHSPCDIAKNCGNTQIELMFKKRSGNTMSAPQLNIPDRLKDQDALRSPAKS